jgi:hypothetical protein
MTPGGLFLVKRAGAGALGPPGSGEPLHLSFASDWLPWLGIVTSMVPVGSSERFKDVWMGRFRYLLPTPSGIIRMSF